MLKVIENENVVNYRTNQQQFLEWLQAVIIANFRKKKRLKSAMLLWTVEDEKGAIKTRHARFKCDLDDYEFMNRCLEAYIQERRFDEFLTEHIGDYIEYIE